MLDLKSSGRWSFVRHLANGQYTWLWQRFSADGRVEKTSEPHLTYAFCRICGVRIFARGELDALGGTFHAVSVPTLDLSPAQLAAIPVRYVNGRDGRYDEAPEHPEAI